MRKILRLIYSRCPGTVFRDAHEFIDEVLKVLLTLQSVIVHIQLFRERLSEKMCTRQSRKVTWDMINTLFLTQ